ncbi:MAG TPA: glycosyltransferase [Streptosporangiaceae bacterium]|nr:glycosyltransferase [Streptosporangiaceae bacterium]
MPPASLEIVVPAHNESSRLPEGLAKLCAKAAALPLSVAVIVVDSASTDPTPEVVRGWPAGPVPVGLLRCDRPGKGLAVRAGFLATRAPFVGFCDADMATDLSALDVVVSLLAVGAPMVIGSRALAGSDVEDRHCRTRRVGAAAFRALARTVLPDCTDTQCGFKFFAGPLARAAARALKTTGFAFDIELIAHCQRLGAAVTEIPVCWRDVPGSTFSVVRHSASTSLDVAATWLRLRLNQPETSEHEAPEHEGALQPAAAGGTTG